MTKANTRIIGTTLSVAALLQLFPRGLAITEDNGAILLVKDWGDGKKATCVAVINEPTEAFAIAACVNGILNDAGELCDASETGGPSE